MQFAAEYIFIASDIFLFLNCSEKNQFTNNLSEYITIWQKSYKPSVIPDISSPIFDIAFINSFNHNYLPFKSDHCD